MHYKDTGISNGKPRSRLQQIQLHITSFFRDTRNQEFKDIFSPVLLGFAPSNKTPFGHFWMESMKQVPSQQ